MTVLDLSPVAIIVSTIVFQVLGYLWYGSIFGKTWLKAIGKAPDQLGGSPYAMIVAILSSLVTAIAVGMLISASGHSGLVAGLTLGLVAAIGFSATTQVTTSAFEDRNRTVTLLSIGYHVIGIALMGIIQGVWPTLM